MGREMGGGIGMGKTCEPKAFSFQCMTELTTKKKRVMRLFSSSLLSAIRVMLSSYLRLLIFQLGILIPACVSLSPGFCMLYSSYKLNKQVDSI